MNTVYLLMREEDDGSGAGSVQAVYATDAAAQTALNSATKRGPLTLTVEEWPVLSD